MANNYITVCDGKKSDPTSINDAVNKSIKGTLASMADYEFDYGPDDKALFFSVIFFSGEIFIAKYNKALNVKKENHLLLKNNFVSAAYNDTTNRDSALYPIHIYGTTLGEDISWEERRRRDKINTIKGIYTSLKPEFIVDIVKDKHIKKYTDLVEKEVSKIPIKFWQEKKSNDIF